MKRTRFVALFLCVLLALSMIPTISFAEPDSSAIAITTQPVNFTGYMGDTAVFTVGVVGGDDVSYQWQYSYNNGKYWNSSGMTGNKTNTASIAINQERLNCLYRCKIKNGAGDVLYTDAVKMIKADISVKTQPENFVGDLGDTAVFSVEVNGGNDVKYQWQYSTDNGENWLTSGIRGNKTNTASITINRERLGFLYRCQIKNSTDEIIYTDAVKIIKADFSIKTQPQNYTGDLGDMAIFGVEVNGGKNVTYQWQYSYDNGKSWNSSGMKGNKTNFATIAISRERLGYLYRCKIISSTGEILYTDAVKMIKREFSVKTQPTNYNGFIGETAVFSVEVNGGKNVTYQWQYSYDNGENWISSGITGNNTNIASVAINTERLGYLYRCKIKSSTGETLYTNAVKMTKAAFEIKTQPVNYVGKVGEKATFSVAMSAQKDYIYQWQYSTNNGKTWNKSGMSGNATSKATIAITNERTGFQYRCKISNGFGKTLYTDAVKLRITGVCYHENTVIDAAVPATCTTNGLTEGSHCADCQAIIVAQQVIPALNHNMVNVEAVAADCDNAGHTAYSYCDREGCDYKEGYEVIPALNHHMVDVEAVAADCTHAGHTAYSYCDNEGCDYKVGYEEIPALNHNMVDVEAVAADCTHAGHTAYSYCDREGCDYKEGYEEIPALTHNMVDVEAVAADCSHAGHTAYSYCDREGCDYKEGYEEIPATGVHTYAETTVPSSGTARGYVLHTCSGCGDSYKTGPYDFSLYEGVDFNTKNKFLIPYNFNSNVYTIEASVNVPKSLSGRGGVLVGNYNGSNSCFNIEVYSGGKIRLYFKIIDGKISTVYDHYFNTDIRSNGVVNLAITMQKGSASLYIDGELKETITLEDFEIPSPGRTLVLGGDCRTGNTQAFKGTVYALAIYRDIRTADEIKNDIISADANDMNYCVGYNIINENSLTGGTVIDDPFEYVAVTTVDDLEYYASIGTENIEIMNDITIDRTIYVMGDVTIYSNTDCSLKRSSSFGGDIFVIGENSVGRNLVLDGITCKLALGKADATGTLTIDGNKENITVDVYGTLAYVVNSGFLTINDNAVLINNKKVANSRTLAMEQGYANMIGGAAIININGDVTVNGGIISNNEVNFNCPANEDNTAENYHQSSFGGAIFNASTLTINGGTITNNSGYYGGAIANYLYCKITKGVISNNSSSHAGGAIYVHNNEYAELFVGTEDGAADDVVFDGNTTKSSGGAIYSGQKCSTLIHSGVTFKNNSAKVNAGALYIGGYGEIDGSATFTNNSSQVNGGAIYVTYNNDGTHSKRQCTFTNLTMDGNTAEFGGAIAIFGELVDISDSTITNSSASAKGGAVYIKNLDDGTGAEVTLNNVTMNTNTAVEGGALFGDRNCEINVTNCHINNNETTTGNGGAISLHGSTLTIDGTEINGNTSAAAAGAVYISYRTVEQYEERVNEETQETYKELVSTTYCDSKVIIKNSTISNNSASSEGGAIRGYCMDSATKTLTCTNVTFSQNSSVGDGGAVYCPGKTSFTDCTFTGNTSQDGGGAIYNASKIYVLTLNNCDFNNNTAAGSGGALYIKNNNNVTITKCDFVGNNANYGGVAIIYGTELTFIDCTFTDNESASLGGVFYVREGDGEEPAQSVLTLSGCELNGASSNYGGAIYGNTNTVINASNTSFTENTAQSNGGAIYAVGEMTLTECDFTDNEATASGGAIYSSGNVTATDCDFGNNTTNTNGGAIYILGNLNITNCEFNNNSAQANGGAIAIYNATNTLTLNGTTFTGNTSTGNGGAIYVSKATITGENNTFNNNSGNQTSYGGGAIYSTGGIVTLSGTSFSGNNAKNGGAIAGYSQSNITLTDTIATSNTASNNGGFAYVNKSVFTLNNSATGSTTLSGNTASGGGAVFGDITSVIDIDGATVSTNTASGSGGAFYALYGLTSMTVKNSTISANTASYGGAAIANGADITFTDCTISGNNSARGAFYIRENSDGTVFSTVTLNNCTVNENTSTNSNGGAANVKAGCTFAANDSQFTLNSADADGGAIYSAGIILLDGCTFSENTAPNGGAIYMESSVATITDTTFTSNTATASYGGAIYVLGTAEARATLTLTNVNYNGNTAPSNGGAIYVAYCDCTVDGGVYDKNISSSNAGVMGVTNYSVVTINDMTATGNSATLGGVFYVNRSELKLVEADSDDEIIFGTTDAENADTLGNSATNGGVIYATISANVTVDGATFGYNKATTNGGAIDGSHASGSVVSVENSEFIGNTAKNGGAIYGELATDIDVNASTFTSNSASYGGAVYAKGSADFDATDSVFTSNTAKDGGAAYIYTDATNTISFNGCVFDSNAVTGNTGSSGSRGGAVYSSYGCVTEYTNVTLKNNISTGNGAGICATYASDGTTKLTPTITINSLTINQTSGIPVYIASAQVHGTVTKSGVVDVNNAGATVKGNLVKGTLTNITFN